MTRSVIIFEDHSFENFRPLALSVPTYEIRTGMFNLRERIELVLKEMGQKNENGYLLCRDLLNPLHTCEGWTINPENFTDEQSTDRFLWISGRCAADFSMISDLLKSTGDDGGFYCFDDHGLIAADLSFLESVELHHSWSEWNFNSSGATGQTFHWDFKGCLEKAPEIKNKVSALRYIWEIVPNTADILARDIAFISDNKSFSRRPFGIYPAVDNKNAFWLQESNLVQIGKSPEFQARFNEYSEDIWLGQDVKIADCVVLDASNGPIILDQNVKIMPHCYLEGPLYLGPGCTVKAGATIYGESSFGIGNRIAGEIGESTFSDFANKQHDGFIGHAVLGSWTNLGAMTTCSDLKNNYGDVRVDLGFGTLNSGLRFVGLLMGDHTKTAIGTLFNTGTCVGFASNIFGGVMPPKYICNFSWGGMPENPFYDVEKAIETAVIVMSRRGCTLSEEGKTLIRSLA